MTLTEIKTLLVSADANIKHYFSKNTASEYSYWEETQQLPTIVDDRHEEHWRFYVHRWVQGGYDRESGYLHHIFECEG